ncbi:hypothetical protein [Dysgonomonas sp. ZJ709]|uniref:hypothetical protein n=1 Tax=Dysgonomonas sp. ZJ709 TaxID=2709797 RepID=UPI0013EA617B|nr:hypothetical protein [Dysgonomonas sp. ZJ709]
MKSCVIYRTDKEYKIVTESETDTGLFISDTPVYILPLAISDEILKDKIINCLENSKTGVKMPETREKFSKWQKEQLANLQEKNFSSLYKKSKSCLVRIESGQLIIYPYECLDVKKGLTIIDDKVVHFNYLKGVELIATQEIIKVLNSGDVPV